MVCLITFIHSIASERWTRSKKISHNLFSPPSGEYQTFLNTKTKLLLNLEFKFSTSFEIYFSSNASEKNRVFRNTKNLNLPKDLSAEDKIWQI